MGLTMVDYELGRLNLSKSKHGKSWIYEPKGT